MVVVGAIELTLTDVALRVATEAADYVRMESHAMSRGGTVHVETKSTETDVVTAVDKGAERLVRDRLTRLRPGEPVIGEEEGGSRGSDITWVIDPIDGTVNFLYGFPWFAVSLAAQIEGVSVAGAVVEPLTGREWTAASGLGAWLDGRRLGLSSGAKVCNRNQDAESAHSDASKSRLDLALVSTGFSNLAQRRQRQAHVVSDLLGQVRDIRRPGAASLDLCSVAAGWVDGYFEHGLHAWDWAAGGLIATEAGATLCTPGSDEDLGSDALLAAAPAISASLREALIACGAGRV